MYVESSGFESNGLIPPKFAADGEDVSPPLRWSAPPKDARQLALICDDPDAPTPEPWVHWVLYQIPAATTDLPENVPATPRLNLPTGAVQGLNSWNTTGYRGPAPPRGHGVHHYRFRLYALDLDIDLGPGRTKDELLTAMEGHILDEGELVGTYER